MHRRTKLGACVWRARSADATRTPHAFTSKHCTVDGRLASVASYCQFRPALNFPHPDQRARGRITDPLKRSDYSPPPPYTRSLLAEVRASSGLQAASQTCLQDSGPVVAAGLSLNSAVQPSKGLETWWPTQFSSTFSTHWARAGLETLVAIYQNSPFSRPTAATRKQVRGEVSVCTV